MSACVVLDVTDAGDWLAGPGVPPGPFLNVWRIPESKRSTVVHDSREIAEGEAKRLAAAHPGRRFCIFEAKAVALTAKVPTHITIGGLVIAERWVPAIADVGEDEGIPF